MQTFEKIVGSVLSYQFKTKALAALSLTMTLGMPVTAIASDVSGVLHVNSDIQEKNKITLTKDAVCTHFLKNGIIIVIKIKENGENLYFKEYRKMTDPNNYVLGTLEKYAEHFNFPEN